MKFTQERDVQDRGPQEVETASLCSLSAGGRLFGIDTRAIGEVLGQRKLERVPLAPAYVGGVVPYRGEVLMALSLCALLGVAPAGEESCVLVLDGETEEDRFGLMVDGVGGVVTVDRAAYTQNPTTLDARSQALFDGTFRLPSGLLVQLDPARLRPERVAQTGLFAGPALAICGQREVA